MAKAQQRNKPKGTPASISTQKTVRMLVNDLGEIATTAQLGIGRQTIGRILAGLTISKGSHALVQARLGIRGVTSE